MAVFLLDGYVIDVGLAPPHEVRLGNAGVPSATGIVPQLQQLKVSDLVLMVAGKDIGSGSKTWTRTGGCCRGARRARPAGNGCWSRLRRSPG
jgi:hypothetical protein